MPFNVCPNAGDGLFIASFREVIYYLGSVVSGNFVVSGSSSRGLFAGYGVEVGQGAGKVTQTGQTIGVRLVILS